MEDVLDVYQHPYDSLYPVVCLDETNRQLIEKQSILVKPGNPEREDYEYRRCGVADLFVAFEPLACSSACPNPCPLLSLWLVRSMRGLYKEMLFTLLSIGDFLPLTPGASSESFILLFCDS